MSTDSPVHGQLQVRNTDVVLAAVQQNLGLQNKQQQTESREGQPEGAERKLEWTQSVGFDMLLTREEDQGESSVCLKGVDGVTPARRDMWRD